MNHEQYMQLALKEAKKAYKKKEVPIGAIIVKNDQVIAKGHNLRELKHNSICHAEIIAINKACKKLNNWRLDDCVMYVTLEPCIMCAGAIINSRIKKVYIGALESKCGAITSNINLLEINNIYKVEYELGILKDESTKLLKEFFKDLRNNKMKEN